MNDDDNECCVCVCVCVCFSVDVISTLPVCVFQWQQEIELRRVQLEEEMQYSRRMEAQKRQDRVQGEESKAKKLRLEQPPGPPARGEGEGERGEEDEGGRSLRRRKPVNYTEKDEDISDLFDDKPKAGKLHKAVAAASSVQAAAPRLNQNIPVTSDISDYSDDDTNKFTPTSDSEGLAVKKVMDPSKGILKLKIKRQGAHSATPPHPAPGGHTPSATYQSPSLHSPLYSPHLGSAPHHRSKSSSGSEKESKHKKCAGGSSRQRQSSTGFQDISDPEEPLYEKPMPGGSGINPSLYSPGPESSGSDSQNPHRRSLKLKLKLTPKESASEGDN